MKNSRLALKILKYVFTGILVFLLLVNVIFIFQKIFLKKQIPLVFGFGNAVIETGSMEPKINPGDMIIIRKQKDYQNDDVITFKTTGLPVTHRIIAKTDNGYITQGDANNTPDKEINKTQVIGKVISTIPKIGYLIWFLQSPLGALTMVLGLFALIEIPKLLEKRT